MKNETNFNPSYIGQRPDIVRLIPEKAKFILDVGCSSGNLGYAVKLKTGATVYGIELMDDMAAEASKHLDKVFTGDASKIILDGNLGGYQFDTIIFSDLLEHLIDPWSVLEASVKYLAPGGTVIASLPNVRHISTIYNLLIKGHWPYRERGIHDKTHLRFFTKKNIIELFEKAGLSINNISCNYRIIESPHSINRVARFIAFPGLKNFLAFQYLICSRKK